MDAVGGELESQPVWLREGEVGVPGAGLGRRRRSLALPGCTSAGVDVTWTKCKSKKQVIIGMDLQLNLLKAEGRSLRMPAR